PLGGLLLRPLVLRPRLAGACAHRWALARERSGALRSVVEQDITGGVGVRPVGEARDVLTSHLTSLVVAPRGADEGQLPSQGLRRVDAGRRFGKIGVEPAQRLLRAPHLIVDAPEEERRLRAGRLTCEALADRGPRLHGQLGVARVAGRLGEGLELGGVPSSEHLLHAFPLSAADDVLELPRRDLLAPARSRAAPFADAFAGPIARRARAPSRRAPGILALGRNRWIGRFAGEGVQGRGLRRVDDLL